MSSSPSCRRLPALLDRGMPGQAEEDVIERRSPEGDVIDGDTRLIEIADDLDQRSGATRRRHGDLAGVFVERAVAEAVAREDGRRSLDLRPLADHDLDALATD